MLIFSACASDSGDKSEAIATAAEPAGLSASELEKGIGPVKNVTLGEISDDLAAQGEEVFKVKCSACHKFDKRYVGPALDDLLEKRTPEFVMNMMLNPQEMIEKHPEVKAMLAQFLTPMPNQNLTEEDARAVLEYIRKVTAD